MSTRYNTGNPIESTDVRDMSDNAKNFDEFSLSTEITFTDRLGSERLTIEGAIEKSGFKPGTGDFSTGFTVMPGMRNIAWYNPPTHGDGNWYSYIGEIPYPGGYVVTPGTDPTAGGMWKPATDSLLEGKLSGSDGFSYIGECPDVVTMRSIIGSSGDKLILSSYGSGWAVSSATPVGGGKFRWVEDNALTDDGVFIFKPIGSSGAWVRQYQRKVTPYLAGAKGDNVDDTDAIIRCFDVATAKGLNVHIDKGKYKYTQTPTVGQVCNVTGEFSVAELYPVGCDGIKFTSSDAVGGRKFGGFMIVGTGANAAGYTAIVVDPGQDISKRTTGVSFEDIQIFNFKTAVDAKNLWHSTFRSFNATNVCNGIVFRGRCVSNEVGSGTKLIRGNGALVSGECIGVQFKESSDYTPSTTVRPEGCTVTESVLVFGFDVAIDVASMLAGGVYGADLDYCRKAGVRYTFWDGRPTISPNWIAGDSSYSSQPFSGVESVAVASQRTTGPLISGITMITFNGNPGDAGIKLGSLNGRTNIRDNVISNANGYGIYDNAGRFNKIRDNQITSTTPLFLVSTGGNHISGNGFYGGTITLNSPTASNIWGENDGATLTGGVVSVPIAAGATSGAFSLPSIGFTAGVVTGSVMLVAESTGGANPGATWAELSADRLTITAHKETAFGSPSSIDVFVIVR